MNMQSGRRDARNLFGIRQRACGAPLWRADIGSVGVGQAAWCPDRARARAERRGPVLAPVGLADLEAAIERLRRVRLPDWVVFAPHEDAFSEAADPGRRREVTAMIRHLLGHGIGVALTTRGSVRAGEALIAIAREHPTMLSVRVGIFATDGQLEEKWERGLAPWAQRLALARALREAGAQVEVELGPLIPFVNDDPKRLRDVMRAIGRSGVRAVAVRWLEDGPGLEEQIEAEVSRSAAGLVGGWFQQPGSNVGSSVRRIIPMQVRRTRVATLEEIAAGLGIALVTCSCVEGGAAVACHTAPKSTRSEQLGLSLA